MHAMYPMHFQCRKYGFNISGRRNDARSLPLPFTFKAFIK